MIDWLPYAGPAAGLAACVAALLLWRTGAAQGSAMARLDARLDEFALALERARTARRDEALLEAVRALRDDVTILCTHVSSLTDGELETKKLVGSAVARELEPLLARLDEAEATGARRAAALRDRIEFVLDRLDQPETRAPEAAPLERLGRIETLLSGLSASREAPVAASPPPAAPPVAPPVAPAVAPAQRDPVAAPEEAAAPPEPPFEPVVEPEPEAAAAPPQRRAPAAFNSGRLASVFPASRG